MQGQKLVLGNKDPGFYMGKYSMDWLHSETTDLITARNTVWCTEAL